MADTQTPQTSSAKNGASAETIEAGRRAADASAAQANQGARAAEAVAEKRAEATRDATRANGEILRTQFETAEQAVRTSMETGMRNFEGLTQSVTRALGVTDHKPELAAQSAQNVRAVSEASTALAKGAQATSLTLFDLAQKSMQTNLEALSQFAACRTMQDAMALQSNLVRTNMQQLIESGDVITRSTADAIRSATEAMRVAAPPTAAQPR